jgi:geranylgeranyl diphosphate synthase type II
MTSSFHQIQARLKVRIDQAMSQTIQSQNWPDSLHNAVAYSLLNGGKRLRPALTMIAASVCGDDSDAALPPACAVEMIHTYSLIHDDLPAMDDDALRRGRPTSHVVFGEALAILAGDALLTLAFETLATADLTPSATRDCLRILATAAGGQGMVGGQVLDLEAERGPFPRPPADISAENRLDSRAESADPAVPHQDTNTQYDRGSQKPASDHQQIRVDQLLQIHRMKTGALITSSLEMGAAVAEATDAQRDQLCYYGRCIGLAFQIADDLLDVTGNDATLGKQSGRDIELGKLTYPSLIGIDASRLKAQQLADEACDALTIFEDKGEPLKELARIIVERDH